ncbi:Meiosis-specific protein HOP1 [Rhizoctonia solani AG-1 IB]|uniref:Meiosis-specific protein HOP1 n=1 Tax=Thanatephorus cucumeris (strain AG1-IB / isolate 7/3/14) TaxID=1108050 RepID=M5BHW2_THACB|nr:Meiosis-specific protein HOP1 [Rhizoctonia solani AG-1 IB]
MNRTKLKAKTSVRPDQAMLTAASSIQVVKTLISSGFGCITWIRGLLSDDNFVDGTLYGSKSDEMLSASSAQGPGQVSSSSTKVKVIKRGFSTEADSLLDYIDGIYDALDKQYLKSFVFAIYLDEENPNNLVEAYTFTISYQTIADTDIIAPVMSLATSISQMDLVDAEDPVAAAAVNGRVPTLGEVKRSVRLLVKRLISVCQQLDPLPDRRFATFKLHYNDKTPQDYEPPNFVAGDPEKDRFYFSTHGVSQPPERFSIGGVGTGQHGALPSVQIEIASICSFLPSPEDNNAPFTGHTVTSNPRSDFVVKETKRKADNQAQLEDAERRRVVWDAEPFGNTEREKEAANTPLGIRRKDGIGSIVGVVRHTGGAHAVPGLDEVRAIIERFHV